MLSSAVTRDAAAQLVVPRENEIAVGPRSPGEQIVPFAARLALIAVALIVWAWLVPALSMMPTRIDTAIRSAACGCFAWGVDDPGAYVLLVPMVRLGLDPVSAMRILAFAGSAAALAATPWRLVLPAAAALTVGLVAGDIYIVPVLAVVVTLPWLLERRRLVAAAAIALVAELFRSGAGAPVLAGVAIALAQARPRRWGLGVAAVAASFAGIHQLGAHAFWNQVYIGFGWRPNPYGIEYVDAYTAPMVTAVDPAAVFRGPAYEGIVRGMVVDLVVRDPAFALSTVAAKLVLLPWVLIAGGLALVRSSRVIVAVMLAAAAIPAVIGDVRLQYETGLIAVGVMAIGWGATPAFSWITRRRAPVDQLYQPTP